MKKKKYLLVGVTGVLFGLYILFMGYICSYENYVDGNYCNCCSAIGTYQDEVLQPLALIVLSLFTTTIFTFFISDRIFKKWLIFTVFYLLATAILVHLAPVSAGGPFGIGPTKELVSMNMSWIFVGISLVMFIWMSMKEKSK